MKDKKSLCRHIVLISALLIASFAPYKAAYPDDANAARFERAKEEFIKGYTYFNSMNYLAAAEYFRKALSLYPDYFTAREYLARSYRLAGYSEESRTEWELLSKDSDTPAVKNKIDVLNARAGGIEHKAGSEFFESQKIVSSEMGRYKFDYPIDMAIDNEKNIYVTSFSLGKVIKLNPDCEGLAENSFAMNSKLYGIDFRAGMLVISDFAHDCVYIADTDLKLKKTIGARGDIRGMFHGPEGVVFDSKGYIYVADSGNNRVQKFSPDGKFLLMFGSFGKYDAELSGPSGVAVMGDRVYVTDTGNNRIAVFDDSGNFIENFSIEGLKTPKGIHANNGTLVIADERAGVCQYDVETKNSRVFRDWDDGKGSFSRVTSALYDRDGFLYAMDHSRQTAFIFSPLATRYSNLDVEIQAVDTAKYPLVAYYLTVKDRSGRPVYGLTQNDFEVIEDGARIRHQYINYLKDREKSISLTIAVDRSVPAKPHEKEVPWVSEFILKKLHKNDSVKVLSFNSDYWIGNNFDWSRRRALKALSEGNYAQGKAIGKTLYGAIADVAKKLNRRAVMLITDGSVDDNSFRQYSEDRIIDCAREHFVPVYVVTFKNVDPSLERIARETGGAVIKASSVDTLKSLYDRIKNSEEYRYVLVYRSFKTDDFADWWSDVTVKVNMKGVSGIEWCGYFVPKLSKDFHRSPGKLPSSNAVAPENRQSSGGGGSSGNGGGAKGGEAPAGGGGH
ncbi:MAG TPA: VWA domain-containing protein [Spirochaetota bacterium]|nr:VWA domain-containing protein [Spirochaetota bacterium]